MTTLAQLITKQQCKCHYCGTTMLTDCTRAHPQQATLEHLIDKWSSPGHQKIEDDNNLVAACYKCNNTRGNARNVIARRYYQELINNAGMKKIKAASTKSRQLYKMFGPVPQDLLTFTLIA
jgi:5-methylcytosine-specific restriction endonuclease McrA